MYRTGHILKTSKSIDLVIDQIRAAETFGLHWKIWTNSDGYHYIISTSPIDSDLAETIRITGQTTEKVI